MKKILLAIPFAVLIGCGKPTPENHCCTEGDCGGVGTIWVEKEKCFEKMVNGLEKKVEIMEIKMHYECGESK